MKVTVEDDREFPDYKNVQINALFRNLVCELVNDRTYWTWDEIVKELSPKFRDAIVDADYLCDDYGNTWARSFTITKEVK
jgi:hypothetical protein